MFGDDAGTVDAVRAFDLHGVTYYDLAIRLDGGSVEEARLGPESVPGGGSVEEARLGPESVPGGLKAGDRVRVVRAGLMIIQVAREQA